MQISPYLFFNGNCREAFEFYEKTFSGKIRNIMTHAESPIAENVAPEFRNSVMHAQLEVGHQILMGSDDPTGTYEPPRSLYVSLGVPDPKESERIFRALAQGGVEVLPYQETFFAHGFGMVKDRFGIPWMIMCEKMPVPAS